MCLWVPGYLGTLAAYLEWQGIRGFDLAAMAHSGDESVCVCIIIILGSNRGPPNLFLPPRTSLAPEPSTIVSTTAVFLCVCPLSCVSCVLAPAFCAWCRGRGAAGWFPARWEKNLGRDEHSSMAAGGRGEADRRDSLVGASGHRRGPVYSICSMISSLFLF